MATLSALFILLMYIWDTNAACGLCPNPVHPVVPPKRLACMSDTRFAFCEPGDNIPDTDTIDCPTGQFCVSTGTIEDPCMAATTNPSGCPLGSGTASLCPETGRHPVPNTLCKNYRLCTTLANGTMTYYTYTCPNSSVFDPAAKTCSITYVCPP